MAGIAGIWLSSLAGCGTPGAPLPPSLNLPVAVSDLAASRTGNQIALTWTMPRRNTDKLLLKEKVSVRVCRQTAASACETAGELLVAPATKGAFAETLPAPMAAGEPRALRYFVELKNAHGRSAGLSNAAMVLAGQAPAPIEGLSAEMRKDGVALHWNAGNAAGRETTVRLHRTLLTPPAQEKSKDQNSLLAPAPESVEQNLFIKAADARGGRTLDASIRLGQTYEYRAQRVAHISVEGKTLELAGEFSTPVRIATLSAFPPAVPSGLAAVASQGENGASIDLSWQPDTELDLTGYIVYRREAEGAWKRLTDKPSPAPAFHDAEVQPGRSYRYAVSAVGQNGHESARSAETQESVPER
jgi:hypothetical protein